MTARPLKHSITLHGHRTSVSLEAAFWEAVRKLALREGISVNQLVAIIDDARNGDAGLASAIRLHVLADLTRERDVAG